MKKFCLFAHLSFYKVFLHSHLKGVVTSLPITFVSVSGCRNKDGLEESKNSRGVNRQNNHWQAEHTLVRRWERIRTEGYIHCVEGSTPTALSRVGVGGGRFHFLQMLRSVAHGWDILCVETRHTKFWKSCHGTLEKVRNGRERFRG